MDFLILFVRLILLDLIILVFCLSDKILSCFNAVRNIKGLHSDRYAGAVRVPYGTPIQKWYILAMLLYRLN